MYNEEEEEEEEEEKICMDGGLIEGYRDVGQEEWDTNGKQGDAEEY